MVNAVSTVTPFQLPEKTHMDSATASVFGVVFQENTSQFATLDTATAIAKVLGGTVVDMNEQWSGGGQEHQYGIQMGENGPILNAGLIATRCECSGVELGLSATLVEAGAAAGTPMSLSDAWAKVQAAEASFSGTATQITPPAATVTTSQTSKAAATTVAAASAKTVAAPAASTPATVETAATVAAQQAQKEAKTDTSRLADAAKQFESMMIGQMLKSVRESSANGWMGSSESGSQLSAVEFGESQMAQAIAEGGGFGLAKMVLNSFGANKSADSTAHTLKDPSSST